MKDEIELRDIEPREDDVQPFIPTDACFRVTHLLEEGIALDEEIKRKQDRKEEILAELLNFSNEYDIPGFKANGICFTRSWIEGRNTLSRELLLSHGVLPSVIEKSYAKGQGYFMKKLFRMKEKIAKPRVV